MNTRKTTILVTLIVFVLIYGFLLSYFTPSYLFSRTTITGGDTPSHYMTAHYLINTLLPQWKIIGWMPGNYAGFPLFQFYFPLPFLIIAFVEVFLPLQIAFKLVTVLGIFLLPLCAFGCLKLMRFPFPAPLAGAVFTLPFLFMEANSMWGGNIPSTLAGEFTYSIGFALLFLYSGLFYRGITENRYAILNGILLCLIGLCHGYTLLFAVFTATFFLFTTDHFLQKAWYYLKVNAIAFLLLGWWIVQLLWFMPYTTRYSFVCVLDGISQVFPPILWPVIALAAAGGVFTLAKYHSAKGGHSKGLPTSAKPAAYLWFIGLAGAVFYFLAYQINLVDIRFIPFVQFSLVLLGAIGISQLTYRLKGLAILPPLLAIVTILLVNTRVSYIPGWIAWDYSGFENKRVWPRFRAVCDYLKGTCQDPRVAYEHDLKNRAAGTVRAFEMLPYFSGRSTLEGLYIQSSVTSPFVFYLQSEISEKPSCPLSDYNYSRLNLKRGLEHLNLFNVSHLIVVTDKLRQALARFPEVVREKDFPPYTVYRLRENRGHYVSVLKNEPVLLITKDRRHEAFQWFRKSDLKTFVAFKEKLQPEDAIHFKTVVYRTLPEKLPAIPLLQSKASPPAGGRDMPAKGMATPVKEIIRPEEIIIETPYVGWPHLVRVSYHPNWHVEGADRIYMASPSFMLIFPTQKHVRLYFAPSFPNYSGYTLSALGVLIVICCSLFGDRLGAVRFTLLPGFGTVMAAEKTPIGGRGIRVAHWPGYAADSVRAHLLSRFQDSARKKRLLRAVVISITGTMAVFILLAHHDDATIVYNKGLTYYNKGDYEAARETFKKGMEEFPRSPIIDETAFHYAVAYFKEKRWQEAIEAFEKMIAEYPETRKLPEALYHIGICKIRLHRSREAVSVFSKLIEEFPDDRWARYAMERLAEVGGQ